MTALPMKGGLGGLFGRKRPKASATQEMAQMQPGLGHAQKPQGADWKGVGLNVAGHIGDAISQHYGGAPVYGPLQRQAAAFQQQGELLAQRQRQQAELQAQRIAAQRDDYNYRLANPMPTAFERNNDAFMNFTPEQKAAWKEMNPEPTTVVPLPDGRTYVGPNSGLGSAFTGRPTPSARRNGTRRPTGMSDGDILLRARKAIADGADPRAVRQRLQEMGVRDPAGI